VKYMILLYASQEDYDLMAGKPTDKPAWSAEDIAAMHALMESWNQELVESGEFVDARGLAAPVHTRRIHGLKNGVPVVTDGRTQRPRRFLRATRSSMRELRSGDRDRRSHHERQRPTGYQRRLHRRTPDH
jgi:hypothetical protein